MSLNVQKLLTIASGNLPVINRTTSAIDYSKLQTPVDTFVKNPLKVCDLTSPEAQKDVMAMYEKMAESIKRQFANYGIDYKKPEIVFKKSLDSTTGFYSIWKDKITINTSPLFYNAEKGITPRETVLKKGENRLQVLWDCFDTKKEKGSVPATYEETMYIIKSVLAHELTHSRQEQLGLNIRGGQKAIIEGYLEKLESLKEMPEPLAKARLSISCPKLFFYNPQRRIPKNIEIPIDTGVGKTFVYSPKDLISAIINYSSKKADFDYYTNILEIEANVVQRQCMEDSFIEICRKYLDEETFELISLNNCWDSFPAFIKSRIPKNVLNILYPFQDALYIQNTNINSLMRVSPKFF